jgi:hypothetical protein
MGVRARQSDLLHGKAFENLTDSLSLAERGILIKQKVKSGSGSRHYGLLSGADRHLPVEFGAMGDSPTGPGRSKWRNLHGIFTCFADP